MRLRLCPLEIYTPSVSKKKTNLGFKPNKPRISFFLTEGVYIITKSKILKCTTIYSEKPNRTVVLVGI